MISLLLKAIFKSHPDPETPLPAYCGKLAAWWGSASTRCCFSGSSWPGCSPAASR